MFRAAAPVALQYLRAHGHVAKLHTAAVLAGG